MSRESAAEIRSGLERAGWSSADLWRATLGVGGDLSSAEIASVADGVLDATRAEHNALAATLNDHFTGLGLDHPILYWHELGAG